MKSLIQPVKAAPSQSNAVQRVSQPTKTLVDKRPTAVVQQKLREQISVSPRLTHPTGQRKEPSKTIQRVLDVSLVFQPGEKNKIEGRLHTANRIYAQIKKSNLAYHFDNFTNANKYLKNDYKGQGSNQFLSADSSEQDAITKEILSRLYHEEKASKEITPDMRQKLGQGQVLDETDTPTDGPDISATNFVTAKACVITALMFSEGGNVLGADSVEGLHHILATRYSSTWRHYSDPEIYKSLYSHLGYKKTVPTGNTSLKNLASIVNGHSQGMVSIDGHMIGFKKEADGTLYVRDNDEALTVPDKHSKKDKQVKAVWYK